MAVEARRPRGLVVAKRLLTPGALRVLREMRDQDEELIYEPGAGWWVGLRQTSGSVAFQLLRLCLLHKETFQGGSLERYVLNEEGHNILDDALYVPQILRQLSGIDRSHI